MSGLIESEPFRHGCTILHTMGSSPRFLVYTLFPLQRIQILTLLFASGLKHGIIRRRG